MEENQNMNNGAQFNQAQYGGQQFEQRPQYDQVQEPYGGFSDEQEIKGPSSAALVCGIVGIIVAFIMVVLFGWIAGLVGLALGILGVSLGGRSRRISNPKKGMGGIVTGIIAIFFSLIITVGLVVTSFAVSRQAKAYNYPLLAKHIGALKWGVIGMMISIGDDESDLDDLKRELDEMSYNLNKSLQSDEGWYIM